MICIKVQVAQDFYQESEGAFSVPCVTVNAVVPEKSFLCAIGVQASRVELLGAKPGMFYFFLIVEMGYAAVAC